MQFPFLCNFLVAARRSQVLPEGEQYMELRKWVLQLCVTTGVQNWSYIELELLLSGSWEKNNEKYACNLNLRHKLSLP